jgi:hypothetical protein
MEPWEYSDGCIYLMRELSTTSKRDLLCNYYEQMSELGFVDQFKHSAAMKENLFKSLMVIVDNHGKKKFRNFVECFLDGAFRNIKSKSNPYIFMLFR